MFGFSVRVQPEPKPEPAYQPSSKIDIIDKTIIACAWGILITVLLSTALAIYRTCFVSCGYLEIACMIVGGLFALIAFLIRLS